ncbi:hypothetical protein SGFS_002380 [Streptomyces graminofaciens]|uniref:Uncharacterized protein n=1 Tax=Streptomyces graminofaciens TaxID=68212 RepID=A0ABM7F059_9ACTN|nr:hypothetical protein [Streptomyces graminofaciens]BBC28947.1 hypothetical protein SGFS_002380 [Streptomyces graminofaciens]
MNVLSWVAVKVPVSAGRCRFRQRRTGPAGCLPRDSERITPDRTPGEGQETPGPSLMLGLDAVPAKVEALRSKAKRLVARGWLAERQPGQFTLSRGPAGQGGAS